MTQTNGRDWLARMPGAGDDTADALADAPRPDGAGEGRIDVPLVATAEGALRTTAAQAQRWGVTPGAEFDVEERPDGLFLRRRERPLQRVYVEPTARCNLSCRTCVRHSWDEPIGTMPMDTYRALIDGLKAVPTLRSMAFWGFGEPLLHPDIVEMIAMAHDLGARTEMISNGLLLDAKMAAGLIEAGLDSLVFSVDGASPASYADIRTGGALGAVLANVDRLRTLRISTGRPNPEIGIEFVAMKRNLGELRYLPSLATRMGATRIVVTNVLPYTEELQDEILYGQWAGRSLRVTGTEWSPEMVLPRADLRGETLNAFATLLHETGYAQTVAPQGVATGGYCRFVNEGAMTVSWDGQVSPCVALMHSYRCYVFGRSKQIRRYTVGSVAEQSAGEIWAAAEYAAFRDRVVRFDFSPCTDCGGCEMVEGNEQDCVGNGHPVCGDCLWAKGVIHCP